MLSGDNSILQRATDAKTNTDNAQIKERIQLAYHSALTGGQGSYTKESLEEELEKEFGANNYIVDDSDNKNWILSAKGQDITIPAGKNDTSKIEIKIGTTNIKEISDLTTVYGETTDYISVQDVQWQMFYDDDSYIYLISSDYVPANTLPNELIAQDGNYGTYCKKFADVDYSNSTYTGTIIDTGEWSKGTESNTFFNNTVISYITNNYLKWVNSDVVSTKNSPNMRAVAFMMDTGKWNSFAGSVKGAYAIGGPTLEMFVLSYNAKHSENQLGTYNTIINESIDLTNGNANSNGYKIKIGSGSWSDYVNGLDATGTDTDSDGNMWVKNKYDKAYGYFLSSPALGEYYGASKIVSVIVDGYWGPGGAIGNVPVSTTTTGFRPLIAIPKSSLK